MEISKLFKARKMTPNASMSSMEAFCFEFGFNQQATKATCGHHSNFYENVATQEATVCKNYNSYDTVQDHLSRICEASSK